MAIGTPAYLRDLLVRVVPEVVTTPDDLAEAILADDDWTIPRPILDTLIDHIWHDATVT